MGGLSIGATSNLLKCGGHNRYVCTKNIQLACIIFSFPPKIIIISPCATITICELFLIAKHWLVANANMVWVEMNAPRDHCPQEVQTGTQLRPLIFPVQWHMAKYQSIWHSGSIDSNRLSHFSAWLVTLLLKGQLTYKFNVLSIHSSTLRTEVLQKSFKVLQIPRNFTS